MKSLIFEAVTVPSVGLTNHAFFFMWSDRVSELTELIFGVVTMIIGTELRLNYRLLLRRFP